MESVKHLSHKTEKIKTGGEVIVLDTGASINPEAEAMLQALHSRSTKGLKDHLKILEARGAENFMSNFYVGYGHKSIGDCGSATVFIEGVSMLAAKAVQDWPLYSGQESSTRYIDFASQPFINPLKTKKAANTQEMLREFYTENIEEVKKHLKDKFPKQRGVKDSIYEKSISARAFDIMRAFLPAGASTNLAWHSNLRQAADRLMWLRHHPLKEVAETASSVNKALQQAFPSSFGHKKYKETEEYMELSMSSYYYHDKKCPTLRIDTNNMDTDALNSAVVRRLLSKRPNSKTELPKWLAQLGNIKIEFQLDFGSFRDIQRHRSVTQRMPLLTFDLGFEDWYLQELPEHIHKKATRLLKEHKRLVKKLGADKEILQYYIPMGYRVSNLATGSLPAWIYTLELRSGKSVHPTLRKMALESLRVFEKKFSKFGLSLYPDTNSHMFDMDRGKQDITLK